VNTERAVHPSDSGASAKTEKAMKHLYKVWLACLMLGSPAFAHTACPKAAAHPDGKVPVVHYKTVDIDGTNVFYREAGPANAPVVLLLHGFPTSSHMFRNLMPLLADRYHVIAPDYPGYGHSDMPDRSVFKYTFANMADVAEKFTERGCSILSKNRKLIFRFSIISTERLCNNSSLCPILFFKYSKSGNLSSFSI
jgi:predicted dienelactone hydrolase